MKQESYLTLIFHKLAYAVKSATVKEILYLPSLIPLDGSSSCVVGLFNLRGHIVRVVDLDMCFGRPSRPYSITDAVVVMESGGRLVGIIANEALEVGDLMESDIEPSVEGEHPFIAGEAKVGEHILMALDADRLLEAGHTAAGESHPSAPFFSAATDEERQLLDTRAANYQMADTEKQVLGLVPLAVAELGGEYIAVELSCVSEFTDVRNSAPVPCTPKHIAGNMNLRGNLLTLVDVRGFLNIAPGAKKTGKAVVASANGLSAGILVDEICDVVYLNPAEVLPPSSAAWAEGTKYVKGSAPYGGRTATVLDVHKLFASGEFIVSAEG